MGLALIRIGLPLGLTQISTFTLSLAAGGLIVYSFWLVLATLTF